ncbi:MAG: hypothetical protein NTW59_05105 [Candidatus Diapherotrites archaeon]|nr:hypothetical protein [Candidatus Diapherotrites archaeon]
MAIGEGSGRGNVYNRALELERRGKQARIVIVDIKRPEYEPPKNLNYITTDVIKYLGGLQFGSVKIVEDKHFFHHTLWGRHGLSYEKMGEAAKEMRKVCTLGGYSGVRIDWKKVPNARKNERRYLKLVMRALAPGGRFIMLTAADSVALNSRLLRDEGFIVSGRALTREETMKSGSWQAIWELEKHGTIAHRIIAVKPRTKTPEPTAKPRPEQPTRPWETFSPGIQVIPKTAMKKQN